MPLSKTKVKQNANVTYTGAWSGLSGTTTKELETAYNISNGKATFNDIKGEGSPLANATGTLLAAGTDYQYDKRLDASTTEDAADGFGSVAGGITDTGVSGAIPSDKVIRIVDSSSNVAKNIKDATGLNLKVYAKDLSILSSPPADRTYVDPARGTFVLPRPVYWSKCESVANLTNAEIVTSLPVYNKVSGYDASEAPGKFGQCLSLFSQAGVYGEYTVQPMGTTILSRGSISFWAKNAYDYNPAVGAVTQIDIRLNGSTTYATLYSLRVNGPGTDTCSLINAGLTQATSKSWLTFTHIFFVWDESKSLAGGKSLRLFVDGVEIASSTDLINVTELTLAIFAQGNSGVYAFTYIDNIKVWDHVVSEDPSFEYNSGTGREDALHTIYGATNNYKPVINGTNGSGVGYRFLAASTDPATATGVGVNKAAELETPNSISIATGVIGTGGALSKSTYAALVPEVDYSYGKRLDASTTQDAVDGFGTQSGGIFDTSASGALASNTYLRLVEGSANIKSSVYPRSPGTPSYGLKVYAKDLNILSSPPADRIYIDPKNGRFVLPCPVYWSKCESLDNLTISAEIKNSGFTIINPEYIYYPTTGKFGNCLGITGTLGKDVGIVAPAQNKGTISCYLSASIYTAYQSMRTLCRIHFTESFSLGLDIYGNGVGGLISNGAYIGDVDGGKEVFSINPTQLIHFYVVWDSEKRLTGGKALRVFINGGECFTTTTSVLDLIPDRLTITGGCSSAWLPNTEAKIDNIKIWDHVVSEDPSFEYNGGAGLEDALHPIYGSANGYKPVLTGVTNGVGYYQSGFAGNTAVITL